MTPCCTGMVRWITEVALKVVLVVCVVVVAPVVVVLFVVVASIDVVLVVHRSRYYMWAVVESAVSVPVKA